MKRLKFHRAIVAIAMMLIGWLPTLAYDFKVNGIYYNITSTDSKTVEVTNGYGSHSYSGSVVIPESVIFNNNSYRVTSIGGYAFLGEDGLTSVKIGDSVTSIGISAFSLCTGLKSIEIPNGITFIDNVAFSGCDGLTEVIFNAENCTYSSNSSASVFAGCKNLTKLTIGNNVKSIPNNAFDGCSNLTSVTIGNSLTSIVNHAFCGCTSLTSIEIPNSVTSIGESAFGSCESLTSIEIPNSVTSIGDDAFHGCTNLTSIEIPNSVTSIGELAFSGCKSLTSIEIPNSVTSIGELAFSDCTGLTSVVWNPVGHPDFDHSSLFNECKNITFFKFGNRVEYIPAHLCYGMSKLSSIEIPNSVTTIGDYAFFSCHGLTSVVIGKSVTSIDDSAFGYCTSLTNVVWNSVRHPDFYNSSIFYHSNNITSFKFGNEVEYIPAHLCHGMSKICSIEIPNSVTSIGDEAFFGCSGLTSVVIGNSVKSIGESAFSVCSSLNSIEIPNSVTSIEDDAFNSCSSLTSVVIGNGVTTIGQSAFHQCTSLTSLVIGSSVKSIGAGAFGYCTSLNKTTCLASKPPTAYVSPFSFTPTKDLYVPSGCKTAYQAADEWKDFSNIVELSGGGNETLAESITLNKTTASLKVAETLTLIATVLPSNTTNKSVTWKSSNTSVATVNANGVVTAVKAGEATITVTTTDGSNKSATCKITVTKNETLAESITLNKTTASLKVAETLTLIATVLPSNTTNKSVTWKSSNISVATVNANGVVTAVKAGEATITATTTDGSNKSATCKITVTKNETLAESITLNKTTASLKVAETLTLIATVLPSNATNKSVTWKSSNTSVATVDSNGKVTAVAVGEATITATTTDGTNKSASCKITVTKTLAETITLNKTTATLKTTETLTLIATVLPSNTTNKSVTWKSSNTSVATVNANGVVTAVKAGEATITATTTDGSNKSATCKITVTKNDVYHEVGTKFSVNGLNYIITVKGQEVALAKSEANNEYRGDIAIPSSVKYDGITYSVTSIGWGVFRDCSSLTSIEIPNSVTSIGNSAFYGCSGLTSVVIGNSVTSIGDYAFFDCSSLTSIEIPNSVTRIGDYAFYICSSLTSVVIGNSVTSIGDMAFYNCSSLTSIEIPNSVTSIGDSAFHGCSSLTNIVVDTGNTKYDSRNGSNAIIETASNTLIVGCQSTIIPNSVTSIGDAFSGCESLTNIEIPNSVTSIGNYAFQFCRSLTSIEIPNSVTSIGDYAFYWCDSLTSIEIPNSVTSIGDYAFWGCSKLTSVEIPNSVTSIGNSAFENCSNLTEITCHATTPPTIKSDTFNSYSAELYVPAGCVSVYQSANYWKNFNIKEIPTLSTSIALNKTSASLKVTETLTLVATVLPENATDKSVEWSSSDESVAEVDENGVVTAVGVGEAIITATTVDGSNKSATCKITVTKNDVYNEVGTKFSVNGLNYIITVKGQEVALVKSEANNEYRGDIAIPSSVKYDGITYSVTSIGNFAFNSCYDLTSIEIPNSVTSIGNYAFEYCTSLTSIEIPNSVTSIGNFAFNSCYDLTSIEIPNSVTSIGQAAFSYCESLTSIVVDAGNSIYDSRNGCNAIIKTASNTLIAGCQNTIIPNSVTSIGDHAFTGCDSLTSIEIPNSVTSIGDWAFGGCSSLTSIQIPNSVTSIGDYAFYWCDSLTSIEIPNSVTSIGDYAFWGCSKLTSVEIPNSVTSIGNSAFENCSNLTEITCHATTPPTIKSDTFNSYSAELYVPAGCVSVYQSANYWKNFNIKEIPTLSTSIALNKTSASLKVTETLTLVATVLPENATNKSVIWKSSNEAVAVVDENGVVTAVGVGEAIITATTVDGSNKSATCKITVTKNETLAESITLNKTTASLKVAETLTLKATVLPSNTTNKSVTWKSSNTSVATVNANGVVTAVKAGEATITATTTDGSNKSATCKIIVTKNDVDHEVETKFSVNGLNYIITVKGQEVALAKSEANNEYRGDIAIPSSVKYDGITYSVTSIGDDAFYDCTSLTSIEIPNSVTSIGDWAFYWCTSLTSIQIPNSVTSIGDRAFSGCSSLTSVVIGNRVTSIGDGAFSGCSSLTSIEIPNSVTSIGNSAFSGCSSLTSIEIPNSVTSIEYMAFFGCSSLTSIVVDSGNAVYDSRNGCNAIIETASNTLIAGCQNTIIPNSVTCIGGDAFSGCSSLTSIQIPNSVTSIGDYAFWGCSKLTSVEIPNSVTSIGNSAFENCSNLTEITCHATTPPTIKSDTFNSYSAELYVPAGCISVYQSANYWKNFNIKEIPTLSTSIALNKTSASLKVTETLTLVATVLPENATNKSVIWKSSNEAVAVVDENGVVTAVGVGEAIITATTVDGSNLSATCKVTVVPTLAESITLDKTEISLEATETATLVATVLPELTTDKSVEWSSSNETVVIVDENGVVTAIALGEATITATTNDGSNLSASCKVIVNPTLATSITLDKTEVELEATQTATLVAKVLPDLATNKSVTWSSSNESIATVDENGVVTAIAIGEATITATTNDGTNLSASCKITVIQLAESIALNKTTASLKATETITLNATVLPATTTNKSVSWTSSNEAVATVEANGVVTAIALGEAVITATTTDGSDLSATCKVTVIPTLAETITLDKTEISLEATEIATLVATVLPELTTNKSVTWTSSNEAVATVDANGIVTAIAVGEATITATTTDGSNLSATCKVTVVATLAETITLDKTEISLEATETATLVATVLPELTTNKSVEWTSSNEAVATVDANGVVTAIALGEAIITAIATDGSGATATCQVTVIPTLAMSIELDKTEVSAEEKSDLQLTATILPEHTTNKEVAWSSSYKWVAKVDNTGLVTMYSAGEVIITATTTDGSNLSATCRINVYSGIDGVNGDNVIVATIGDNILVKNAPLGSNVRVYASDGAMIATEIVTDGSVVIEAPIKGIYVVAIDSKSFKVMVK